MAYKVRVTYEFQVDNDTQVETVFKHKVAQLQAERISKKCLLYFNLIIWAVPDGGGCEMSLCACPVLTAAIRAAFTYAAVFGTRVSQLNDCFWPSSKGLGGHININFDLGPAA